MADLPTRKRARADSGPDPNDTKNLRDILSFLDDSDPDPTALGLDLVMKSFEHEISPASSPPLVYDSGESQPELGYLLEASDDELGLPPSVVDSSEGYELVRVPSDSSEIGEFWGFELSGDDLSGNPMSKLEYVAFDGLFDHSDGLYKEISDYSEVSWWHETMPAQ